MISVRKVWTVAVTEFLQAVRSKAFIIGVLLMPALGLISAVVPKFAGDEVDKLERKVAVVDETGRLYPMLSLVAEQWNAAQVAKDGTIKGPRFRLQEVKVAAGRRPDDVRVELSERVRHKDIFAFVELPKALFADVPKLRYYTDSPTFQPLPRWLEAVVGRLVIAERLRSTNVDPQTLLAVVRAVQLDRLGLMARGDDGRVAPAKVSDPIRSFVTPMVLMMLMFIIVISTASPLLNSVMEEKMTRISEVLLGSLSPFELMAGKLLGVVGVSMVLSVIYLSGAYAFAVYHGYGDAVSAMQVVWFVVYLVLAMLIYGSLFIAIGAAVERPQGRAGADDAGHDAVHVTAVHLGADPAGAGQHAGRRRVAGALRDAGADDAAPGADPGPARLADRARLRPDAGGDGFLRLGRRPHLPHRHPDAGQERDLRRDVALVARQLKRSHAALAAVPEVSGVSAPAAPPAPSRSPRRATAPTPVVPDRPAPALDAGRVARGRP